MNDIYTSELLPDSFLLSYKHRKPPFGFNGLGEITYLRTYSRIKENGKNETWWETVARVVNGTFRIQKNWIDEHRLGWDTKKAKKSAQEMYDRIFNMKFMPPGRGLWAMGSPITEERKLFAALNNCAFVSTADLKEKGSSPFCFLMDASMLGVGVGFDIKGAGSLKVKGPNKDRQPRTYQIPDTREGWVESVRLQIDSYFHGTEPVVFDYSLVRAEGQPIKGFGGVSSGPAPLQKCHKDLATVLEANLGEPITGETIVNLMNMIGVCVVSGNVRRSAEIVFGDPNDENYLSLKDYSWDEKKQKYVGPRADRSEFGWSSNNSVFATLGMDYTRTANQTAVNGEPGYAWLDNMKAYSRMNNGADNKDHRVAGGNPCLEQSLEDMELCCLVETYPNNHENVEDFVKTLKYAYMYAKTVTLCETHWPETNRVMLRNRRIGCSMSGIAQFCAQRGIHTLKEWCTKGYDAIEGYDSVYSDWFAIPKSIKKTSVKPSGTVSLVAGATPGVHFPISRFYIRRIRLSKTSELVKPLSEAGYKIEPSEEDPVRTVVVEVPIDIGPGVRSEWEVSMWEKLQIAAFMQRYWADNQVSCTVTFQEHEAGQIKHALEYFQYQLKGISFLPLKKKKMFNQMPYETIDEATYNKLTAELKPLRLRHIENEQAEVERFCNNDTCTL